MDLKISFETLLNYDPGTPGISLDVELRLGRSAASVSAKIDTGSTHCIFARHHAEDLGLDVESGDRLPINTARGSFVTFGHPVTLMAAGYEFDSMVFFAADEDVTRNVLGRHGWLDRMIVGINDYDGKLYLKPHGS